MNPIHDFKGHVALVTGASSAIGFATAKAFAEAGAAVIARAVIARAVTARAVTACSRNAPHSTIPGASR